MKRRSLFKGVELLLFQICLGSRALWWSGCMEKSGKPPQPVQLNTFRQTLIRCELSAAGVKDECTFTGRNEISTWRSIYPLREEEREISDFCECHSYIWSSLLIWSLQGPILASVHSTASLWFLHRDYCWCKRHLSKVKSFSESHCDRGTRHWESEPLTNRNSASKLNVC